MFRNRKDAALKLANALSSYRKKDAIVLGIPRGGAEIGYYVAIELQADFSLIITRKLGYPSNPEAAFGAMAEDGSVYIMKDLYVSKDQVQSVVDKERKEIKRRIDKLRDGKPLPDIEGRIVILADDGIATGATLLSAISMCKKRDALKIVAAAPISSPQMANELRTLVDDVVILEKPDDYYAVSQGYEDFENLSDEETIAFIQSWEKRKVKSV
jgi:putative phosphoribosyl transferase